MDPFPLSGPRRGSRQTRFTPRWSRCTKRAGMPKESRAYSRASDSQGFNRDLVASLFPAGKILLARARAGDVTLGCDYSFIERNRVLGYQWGIAKLEDSRPSPGLVTGVVMQEALERGIGE